MDVFCCCFRRQSEQSSQPTPCQPTTAETSGDLPSATQPTTHPSPSSRPRSSRAGAEPNTASQSRSPLRPVPIPGAPLEPVDISQLVIDDSDGGGESPPTKSKKSRASSTLDFVRTRLRNQGSQDDSLRRQSATTVGSSTEELARRAELKRLMRKRIQEELETDNGEKASQTAASDGPSACAKLPATPSHADRLPGGGPRDKIEFSVVQAVEDAPAGGSPNRKENVPLNRPGCSRTESRRASCPDHLSPSNEAKVSRTASRGVLRDKRNSMPQLSSISSTTPLSLPSMSGSSLGSVLALATSSSDSEKQDTSATGRERQAVAAVVVSGGFSPRDISRKSCDDSKSKQVEPSPVNFLGPRPHTVQGLYRSRSGSPASNAESTGSEDCGQSPMRIWLRSQDLYSALRASSDCDSSTGVDVGGPTAAHIPKSRSSCPSLDLQASKAYAFTATNPSSPVGAVQDRVESVPESPQAHKGSHGTSDRPGSSAEYVTHLRGGILEDADTATSIGETTGSLGRQLSEGSTGHGAEPPCLSRSRKRDSLSSLPSSGKHLPSASATNSDVAPVSPSPRLTADTVQPGTERANARATDSHSPHPEGNSSPREDQRSSSPTSRLPLPGPPRTATDSPSAFASDSEASSFHRREEELLTIPMRFAESKSRRKPNLHSVSRFKEDFRDEYDEHQQPPQDGEGSQSPSEKPSLFARLHLTVPRKARLDSKVVCTDGETAYPSAPEGSKYSSMRSIRGSGVSRGSLSARLDVADMSPSNCQRESAETVWRRAIRAEADERLSLARVSGGHRSIANSNSGTKGHPDSHETDGKRPSARHAADLGHSSACDHGHASPARSGVPGKRYENDPQTDLGRSSIVPHGSPGRHSGEAYASRQTKMLSTVEGSEIPRSWARFPSHTREERNGPAGPECDIASRDFAAKTPGNGDGDAGWVTDKDSPAPSRRTPLGARIVSGRLGRLLKIGVSKMLPSRSSSRTTGKGANTSPYPSRSHSPDDTNLEYPELQIQPNEGAFREMQALEQDIVSLRSGTPRSPQPLADGPGGERIKTPASVQGASIPDRAGRASNASDNAEEYSTAAEAKTPLTPPASRLQPHPDTSTMTAVSSTANSDHFLTPVSRMSPRGEGARSASWHRSPGMLSVDAFRNDDAASHMSSGTVVKKTQSGTELGVPENQQRTCRNRSSTQPDPSAPHEE